MWPQKLTVFYQTIQSPLGQWWTHSVTNSLALLKILTPFLSGISSRWQSRRSILKYLFSTSIRRQRMKIERGRVRQCVCVWSLRSENDDKGTKKIGARFGGVTTCHSRVRWMRGLPRHPPRPPLNSSQPSPQHSGYTRSAATLCHLERVSPCSEPAARSPHTRAHVARLDRDTRGHLLLLDFCDFFLLFHAPLPLPRYFFCPL